ncbi:MAG: hypothetical protein JWO97_2786 [Acidobacteria bacterium]|nr:hypothetical protein [Acidobacteriota bacterium]
MKQLVLVVLASLALTVPVQAADPAASAKPQLYLIHEEIARPSMLAQYESTTNELLTTLTEKKADPKVFGMNLYVTNDLHYVFVLPISNWAAIEGFQQSWAAIGDAVGKEKWANLMKRGNQAMESFTEIVVMRRPDLSYEPAMPRIKPEDARFAHWAFYYLDPARADEAEQVAKDYASLFKAKNVGDGFSVFMAVSGSNLPLLIVSVPAKSAADFYATDEKINAAFGNDIRPLAMRAMAITRRYETRDAVLRPDMSFPLPAK